MVVWLNKLSPHKHCIICGNAIESDRTFCDELCESKYRSAQRRQQLVFVVFLMLMIATFVLLGILPALLGQSRPG